ncbi:MAG: hypothetical protein IPM35_33295 [Myxococcales bacterium]|nr:hypothetical protein [Myxococcales bacterium]
MLARLAVTALLALSLLSGCGYFRRVGECRRLAVRVNTALDEIAAAHDAGGATPESHRDLASRYEVLAGDVESSSRRDDALGKTLKEYSLAFTETARSLRALADAMDKQDPIAASRLRREMGNLARRDKTLVARIDGLCAEP